MAFGVKIYVSGDHISPDESAVLVMNHRTRVDWNFLWAAMYQACMPKVGCHKLKFILKDPIRHIPGPGNVPYLIPKLFTKVYTTYICALLIHTSVTPCFYNRMDNANEWFPLHNAPLGRGSGPIVAYTRLPDRIR